MIQTKPQNIAVHLRKLAALGENGSDALLRKLEAVHDGLTTELGVEEELFVHNDIADVLEELVVGEILLLRGLNSLRLCPFFFPVYLCA